MKTVIQRVLKAQVDIDGETVGTIGRGIVILLGIHRNDEEKDVQWLLNKTAGLRIFEDENGKMNRSLQDIGGEMLIISQFTLYGDCRKGRRPGFSDAAPPQHARQLYDKFIDGAKALGIPVAQGIFQADMQVSLINDGPVTFIIDTHHLKDNS